MMNNSLVLITTITYNRAQGVKDTTELYNNVITSNNRGGVLAIIVAVSILYVLYAFMYVSFWYIDKHLNNSRVRLFTIITLGKTKAEEVDAVSAVLYSALVVFIVLLIFTGALNVVVSGIFNLLLGG